MVKHSAWLGKLRKRACFRHLPNQAELLTNQAEWTVGAVGEGERERNRGTGAGTEKEGGARR